MTKGVNIWICKGCGKDCELDNIDYYVVRDAVWKKYGVGKGMLCMDCIEKRMGRKLAKKDIEPCFVTQTLNTYTAAILNKKNNKAGG